MTKHAGRVCAVAMAAAMVFGGVAAWSQETQPGVLKRLPPPAADSDMARRLAEALKDYHGPKYVREEVFVPVRDGATLHTTIVRPEGSETTGVPLPILMQRTPYGIDGYSEAIVEVMKPALAASGYIWVFQDIRGRYKSGGQFVMNRPVVAHNTPQDVDETTDTRDTIDWLLKHVANNNGRVGVYGVSYPGFLAIMAGIQAHPAVKAISPQAPMTDIWIGDDFFHNGAFRETYGFDYVQQLEAQKTDIAQSSKEDQYDFFLKHVNFAGAAASAGMTELPTAKRFLTEPVYTKFWQDMAVERRLSKPEVPTLEVGGFWDQEDMWGPQAEYAALRPHEAANDPQHRVFLVLGPWNHGGWGRGAGDSLGGPFGKVEFGGQHTGEYYRDHLETPFFEFYLKDKPGFDLKDTASFRTGENQWHRYESWPPTTGVKPAKLFLASGSTVTGRQPTGGAKQIAASYTADPANPIPYRHRPVQSTYGEGSVWRTWLAEDQKFVADRKDMAHLLSPVLSGDVTVTGDVVADLFASTTGSDSDWVVKLIDVYPDNGYRLMVADEILRGRYRHGFETAEPVKPGEVAEYKWSLHAVDHTFLKGHRILVEVQSSWFPLYDRNPQTFVPNIMSAPADAYKPETITIFSSPRYPSHLDVSVGDGSALP